MLKKNSFLFVVVCFMTILANISETHSSVGLIEAKQQKIKIKPEQKIAYFSPVTEIKKEPCFTPIDTVIVKSTEDTKEEQLRVDLCLQAALKAEKEYQIKPELLQTIASVESGLWSDDFGRRVAWPWAVQVDGKGYYYKSKAEAVQRVKELYQAGITNIDVGCMQINLKYHGQQFRNIEDAFDPNKNVRYAAQYLKKLYNHNGKKWQITAMQYHSKNYEKGIIYKGRLEKHYAKHINPNSLASLF